MRRGSSGTKTNSHAPHCAMDRMGNCSCVCPFCHSTAWYTSHKVAYKCCAWTLSFLLFTFGLLSNEYIDLKIMEVSSISCWIFHV
jgi:hypothetical protein